MAMTLLSRTTKGSRCFFVSQIRRVLARRPRCAIPLSSMTFLRAQHPRPDPDDSESVCYYHIATCFSFIESILTILQYPSYRVHP
ncbi:uncharacterized protein BDW47DRAFT_108194 [Aspergillus candidus]|uniref:Uncharacterized protein n=1 Tax=Aspergillus candidus TaxID=41067 RepID=A0A2I2F7N2_ASPCN|nr:hypothetical protein BDW47DRAFT_108194 [Aspergillus candidus]PLB36639.1 hypothetical protein BDW47DRAFT_108194 [Aspergillus candidus]